jgi:hypothetical protein
VGLAGLGGGAILAYRRQKTTEQRQGLEEARNLLENRRHELERQRHDLEIAKQANSDMADLRARYAKAAEQLGNPAAAVRLAGVYALAALADDWHEAGNFQQQVVCVDLLCAYLRMPYDPNVADSGEKEVRQTILSSIRERMQNTNADEGWCHIPMDFSGAVFDGGRLAGVHFAATATFDRCKFVGDFSFLEARVTSSGTVNFRSAKFSSGEVSFRRLAVHGGTVDFRDSAFEGAYVNFFDASFAKGSRIVFEDVSILAGRVQFHNAKFKDSMIGFKALRLQGGALSFDYARFGYASTLFVHETIFVSGEMHFDRATFDPMSTVQIEVPSSPATSGKLSFDRCNFAGGLVDIHGVNGGPEFLLDFGVRGEWITPPISHWTLDNKPNWVRFDS